MLTLEGTTLHPRRCLKEWRFNDANLSKHECACSKHRYVFMDFMRKQTYQCAQYKLKIVYKTWQQNRVGKNPGFKKKKQLGFIVFFWGGVFIVFFLGFIFFFLYYCVFKLFLTRKKKITVQQMFHLEVLLRHLSEYCGCHYGCAEQDVQFLTQHMHL